MVNVNGITYLGNRNVPRESLASGSSSSLDRKLENTP